MKTVIALAAIAAIAACSHNATPVRPFYRQAVEMNAETPPVMRVHSGDVLSSARVHLFFSGATWVTMVGRINESAIVSALKTALSSRYVTAASQYNDDGRVTINQPMFSSASFCKQPQPAVQVLFPENPPTTLADLIDSCINTNRLTVGHDDLFVLMLPPGVHAIDSANQGLHLSYPHTLSNGNDSGRRFAYAMISYDPPDTSNMSQSEKTLAFAAAYRSLTDTMTHELIESVTDPYQDGIYGHYANDPVDCLATDDASTCEIADVCENEALDQVTKSGIAYARWWDEKIAACEPTKLP